MLKNNLFVKINLSFWLTMIFMIGSMLVLDWLTDTGPFRFRRPPDHGNPLSMQGHAAIWVFEHEGKESLKRYLETFRTDSNETAWLFDGTDLECTGAQTSDEAKQLARLALEPGGQNFVHFHHGGFGALRLMGSDGKAYAIVSRLPSPPPPSELHSPGLLAVRLLVLLMVSGLICFLLAKYLTSPILALGRTVRQFAAGDLSARSAPHLGHRNDEVARLAADFDSMAESIESLLTSQRVLLRDISHELRSPLARLNVALELCRRRSGPDLEKNLERIDRESCKINDMIDQLLTIYRTESGVTGAEPMDIDLNRVVCEIAEDADFEAKPLDHGVTVTSEEGIRVRGNEALLRRAIENVIRNAVHYTEAKSTVEVSLIRAEVGGKPYARLRICDRGKGVPEETLPHLFKPFYRVDIGRERETGGVGLGLAITESAVRLHNGSIIAKNRPDGGLMVEITLSIIDSCISNGTVHNVNSAP
jgi:two-component system, OmpR family, sensor histidine kinase CpxA